MTEEALGQGALIDAVKISNVHIRELGRNYQEEYPEKYLFKDFLVIVGKRKNITDGYYVLDLSTFEKSV